MLLTSPRSRALVLVVGLGLTLAPAVRAQVSAVRPRRGLTAFKSDADIEAFLRDIAKKQVVRSNSACVDGSTKITTVSAKPGSETRSTTIRGVVLASNGEALSEARVAIASLALDANTPADGRFALAIPAAKLTKQTELTMRALRIGYQARQAIVSVAPGDSVVVEFRMCASAVQLEEVVLTSAASAAASDAITNVQHAGVDEGDIVKLAGNYLVVLRRGRLFTVAVNDNRLDPITAADAFGPDIDPAGAWYDELLLYRDKVVVVGYSYARGGTEVGVFKLGDNGGLTHQGTYHIRSNDYYSARNYASRLIGSKLVFYTPLFLRPQVEAPLAVLPAMRKWHRGATAGEFRRIATTSRIYRPPMELQASDIALHTVTSCDLASNDLKCEATGVFGPAGEVFYVSPNAVYVWTSSWRTNPNGTRPTSIAYRMPLDGSLPTAVAVSGSPVDQFSFLESDDGFLNVLVRANGRGDWMWQSEKSAGGAALLRVSLDQFGDGTTTAPRSSYRQLPTPEGYSFQNRFVGNALLYGIGNGWGRPKNQPTTLFAVQWKNGWVNELALSHPIDRIEVMGGDAVIVGADSSSLFFSGVSLEGRFELRQRYVLRDAAQGELRSHGFFYRSDDSESGVIGLPVRNGGKPGSSHLVDGSASVMFIRNHDQQFDPVGQLAALSGREVNDACRASCVDWYGNARPLFFRNRVFALLGYELVEGNLREGRIDEVRRVNFGPKAVGAR